MCPIRGHHSGSFQANLLREVQIFSCTGAELHYPWLHISLRICQGCPKPSAGLFLWWWRMSSICLQCWCNIMCSWLIVQRDSSFQPENEVDWKGLCHLENKLKAIILWLIQKVNLEFQLINAEDYAKTSNPKFVLHQELDNPVWLPLTHF